MLDLSALENAVGQLRSGIEIAASQPGNELVRDGVIQRFEYTYELSHKMLRRFLAAYEASPAQLDVMSFPDMIRLASQRGLLRNGWDMWSQYREARGTTSHTYNRAKAEQVFAMVPRFLDEASDLLQRMQQRIEANRHGT